jgi:protein ImuB
MPPEPDALVEPGPHGIRLAAVSPQALRKGVRVGQPLADARALSPGLVTAGIDRAADAAALAELAQWATRWTPWVGVDGLDGLLLDVTGCAHLVGGEVALLADMEHRLRASGLTIRVALAGTVGAAWALARFGATPPAADGTPPIVSSDGAAPALAPLPVAALRITPGTVLLLERLGLKHVRDLMAVPRAALARRFPARELGEAVVSRLDQALGQLAEPVNPAQPPPLYRVPVLLAEPLLERAQLEGWLPRLVAALLPLLEADGRGARRLTLKAIRVDGTAASVSVGLAQPSREAGHMLRLFADRLEALDPGFGCDALVLEADAVGTLPPRQEALLAGRSASGAEALARLVDTLANRLGASHVHRLVPAGSHRPERAEQAVPVLASPPALPAEPWHGPRPLLLLDPPEPAEAIAEVPDGPPLRLVWRRMALRIVRSTGPERLAPEWWGDPAGSAAVTRDYYVAETEDGRRLWLCRAGLYDDPATQGSPRWLVQGWAA